jgi:hypothetical protein
MKRIIEYKNVASISYLELDKVVNKMLLEGWIPFSGITYIPNTSTCVQTLVKYEDEKTAV